MSSLSPTSSVGEFSHKQPNSLSISRTGNLLKLGDGLMNRSWNPRYFLLRGSTLQYFTSPRDVKPREVIDLVHAEVAWLGDFMDRSYCIAVEPVGHRSLHVSGSSLDEAKQWMRWFQEAADPSAYANLPPACPVMSPVASSSAMPQRGPSSYLNLPSTLPAHFTEAAHLLEKIVNAGDSGKMADHTVLVDVVDGMRVFASIAGSTHSHPTLSLRTILIILCGLILSSRFPSLLLPFIGIATAMFAFYKLGSPHRKSTASPDYAAATAVVNVSLRGCRNWLMDASKSSSWTPQLRFAFSNPINITDDQLHLIFEPSHHISFARHTWEAEDGSVCIVASSGDLFESWCVRNVSISTCRVWFISSRLPVMPATERVSSALSGLSQICTQMGDHEGISTPHIPLTLGWLRHSKGGLVITSPTSTINGCEISKNLLSSSIFGSRKLCVKSVFSMTGKSPLQTIPNVLAGLVMLETLNPQQDALRAITAAVIGNLHSAAGALAECAWTRHHPKVGESLLCWLGTDATSPQVFLEVIQASRPNQGLFASVRVGVTGHSWTLKGVVKYTILLNDRLKKLGAVNVCFSQSELQLELTPSGPVRESRTIDLSLPDLVAGVSPDKRIFWEGVVRVSETNGQSVVMRIDPSGTIYGSVLDVHGRKIHNVDGHWLENLYVDTDLVWTLGKSPNRVEISFKKKEVSEATKSGAPESPRSPKGMVRMSSADEEAAGFISMLRQAMPELENDPRRFTDEYIYRFSKARHFDLAETKRMLHAHVDWLEEHRVDQLSSFEFTELPLVKAAFPHGYHGVDKWGRPIYISRAAKTNQERLFQVTDWDRFIKFWIQSYEDLIWKKIPACTKRGGRNPHVPGVPDPSHLASLQTLTIMDLKGLGMSQFSMKVKEFIVATSKLASENYPEVLGTMYIVNSPAIFPMIWNGIKPTLDPGTRAKVHVFNVKQTREKLLEVVDFDQLPHFLGGGCKCNLDPPGGEDSDYGCLSSDKGPWASEPGNR